MFVIPLGGVEGFVGQSCFLIGDGDYAAVLDCGTKPQTYEQRKQLGEVDEFWVYPPPRLDILDRALREKKKIVGFATHAHLDHMGAIAELTNRGIPVGMSRESLPFTYRYVENLGIPENFRPYIFSQHKLLRHGDLEISFIPVRHSIPGTHAVLVRSGRKSVLYLTDFKLNGMNESWQESLNVFREIKSRVGRVDCLIVDILNTEIEGFTPPEQLVLRSVEKVIKEARGRIIITFFASNLERMEAILKIAESHRRTVGIAGWGMNASYSMLRNETPDRNGSLLLIGGSQGENNSALARMARGEHQHVHLSPEDTVMDCSRCIPGNEEGKRIVFENIHKAGAELIVHLGETDKLNLSFRPKEMCAHVSGHERKGGRREVINILDPKIIVPCHGPEDRYDMFKESVRSSMVERLQVGETLEI